MSTCNGLKGSIRAHGEYFAVEPASFASSLPTSSSGFVDQSVASGHGGSASIGFSPSSLPTLNANPLHNAFPLGRIPNTGNIIHDELRSLVSPCIDNGDLFLIDHLVYRHADLQEEEKTCGLPSDSSSTSTGATGGHDHSNNDNNGAGAAGRTANGDGNGVPAIPATNNNGAFTSSPINDETSPAGSPAATGQGGHGPNGERETIELLIFNDNQRWKK